MSANIKPQLKVLGRDVGLRDWIAVNDHGVMKMGRVKDIRPSKGFWLHVELADAHGGSHHVTINRHDSYALFTFSGVDDGERYDDELIHMIRGVGRNLAQRYARMDLEKLKQRSDYKYRARDGRLVFKDGSRLRINEDETRTVFDSKDQQLEWPQLSKWS